MSEVSNLERPQKVVVNRCYGGFSVSLAAAKRMAELGHAEAKAEVEEYDAKVRDPTLRTESERKFGLRWYGMICRHEREERADPILVQVVEELGDAANGELAKLDVAEVPAGAAWHIEEYDGREWVAEDHRTW